MSKRKERMRARVDEGRKEFIIKEGLYHFAIKLWLLYMVVTFIISFRFDFTLFLTQGELLRSGLYLLVFLAIGAYWGFIWYQVHLAEIKQEAEQEKHSKKSHQKARK
ncbi:hypothetical protein [Salipaludibacillus daqingensis]|uniref:hypothetical protein n=1 Tax=Salipaludibacillus daqingensis TaxID=3041001 RepID=UPI002474049F|nr:hypothetical protein [Salipaludibacillus daqingensis]